MLYFCLRRDFVSQKLCFHDSLFLCVSENFCLHLLIIFLVYFNVCVIVYLHKLAFFYSCCTFIFALFLTTDMLNRKKWCNSANFYVSIKEDTVWISNENENLCQFFICFFILGMIIPKQTWLKYKIKGIICNCNIHYS